MYLSFLYLYISPGTALFSLKIPRNYFPSRISFSFLPRIQLQFFTQANMSVRSWNFSLANSQAAYVKLGDGEGAAAVVVVEAAENAPHLEFKTRSAEAPHKNSGPSNIS